MYFIPLYNRVGNGRFLRPFLSVSFDTEKRRSIPDTDSLCPYRGPNSLLHNLILLFLYNKKFNFKEHYPLILWKSLDCFPIFTALLSLGEQGRTETASFAASAFGFSRFCGRTRTNWRPSKRPSREAKEGKHACHKNNRILHCFFVFVSFSSPTKLFLFSYDLACLSNFLFLYDLAHLPNFFCLRMIWLTYQTFFCFRMIWLTYQTFFVFVWFGSPTKLFLFSYDLAHLTNFFCFRMIWLTYQTFLFSYDLAHLPNLWFFGLR